MRSPTVAIGVGSNLKNPIENLRRALKEIKKIPFFEVIQVSSIYESDAQLPQNAPQDWDHPFLNAVILCKIDSAITPEELLREIKKIEIKMGRQSTDRWAPRLIDIDILYWSRENYSSEQIQIPHTRLTERPFALLPLLEVLPNAQLNRPHWVSEYIREKPFNTKRSVQVWPKMVGILNITKDSFSDGAAFLTTDNLIHQYEKLVQQGADIIDIGAESTRPGAIGVTAQEEYEKLSWALKTLNPKVPVSLDCRNSKVAEKIIEQFDIQHLNDVTGFSDPLMIDLLKKLKLQAFVMHSLSVPPRSDLTLELKLNPCEQLKKWWKEKRQSLIENGVSEDQLVFDPGIGFGKSAQQSLYILKNLEQFSEIKNPMMIAHSRKSFLNLLSNRPASQRDLETAMVTKDLNQAYVQYLRVHDMESQLIALRAKAI